MLKRATISFGLASIAGIFGFTGVLETTAPVAQSIFYLLTAFSLLSLILSLFEEAGGSAMQRLEAQLRDPAAAAAYQLVFDFPPGDYSEPSAAMDKA